MGVSFRQVTKPLLTFGLLTRRQVTGRMPVGHRQEGCAPVSGGGARYIRPACFRERSFDLLR